MASKDKTAVDRTDVVRSSKSKESMLAFSPIKAEKSCQLPDFSFTWLDIFVVLISMGTYIADIVTDVLVMLVYWKIDEVSWAALTLTFLIVPAVIMQIFSARWYIADGRKISVSMVVVHLILMGPIRRYISVLYFGLRARRTKKIEDYQLMYAELSDVSMLRLFECFLESAPQLVLQLYIMIRVEEGDHILTGISACFSLLSLSWTIVAYTKALRAAVSRRRKVSWPGITLQTIWRVGMVLGRITAIVLFATIYQEWSLLLLGLHWLLMTGWVVAQDTDFCNTWWEERLFNVIIGVIYVFCFFNMKEGRSRGRVAFYYAVVLVENSIMIMLWWPERTPDVWYNVPALVAVWGGFVVGLSCMALYYQYFHPASEKRCHCCTAWHRLRYLCHCQHPHNTHDVTPYKKGRDTSGSDDFDSTLSSSEELDRRDFTELRCSYETPTTFEDVTRMQERVCIKHQRHPHHNHAADHRDEDVGKVESQTSVSTRNSANFTESAAMETIPEKSSFVVVGNARSGFKVKSHRPLRESLLRKMSMPRPRATSTPGEELKTNFPSLEKEDENFKEVDLQKVQVLDSPPDLKKICPTPKSHRPGSPNTLIKNWVRRNQEMYEKKEGCFAPSSSLDVDSPAGSVKMFEHVVVDVEPSGRQHRLRMKSFSKRDRERRPTSFHNKQKNTTRNSFREAFGFHVIDLDDFNERRGHRGKVARRKRARSDVRKKEVTNSVESVVVTLKQNVNSIKCRIDEPPPVELKKLNPLLERVQEAGKIHRVGGDMNHTKSAYDNLESHAAPPSVKQDMGPVESDCVDRVELLYKDGIVGFGDGHARKKLKFKSEKQKLMKKSVEALEEDMDGVMDENYRMRVDGMKSFNEDRRKVLGSIENKIV
ncbi:uncharacterized protein LOC143450267 [Clavelina lepadiformis]|uniref:uncharacterized protein LOC143450267 n=1 Tax=Clavelina lepadiformis TaxID=159417 RepID=UPI0040410256